MSDSGYERPWVAQPEQNFIKKPELVQEIAARTGFRVADVTEVYDCLMDIIEETVLNDGAINLPIIEIGSKMKPEKKNHWDGIAKKYIELPARPAPYIKFKRSFTLKYLKVRKERMLNE